MRIVDIRERTIPISRYASPTSPSGDLNTTAVAIVTDVHRDREPIVGFGLSSFGRFGQSGLIRERLAPRLLAAREEDLSTGSGDSIDLFRAWDCLMQDEKPGGHGERCVAVGTLDMALWDAAAKNAEKPLYRFLGELAGIDTPRTTVPVYAGGGYYFPSDDIGRLTDEVREFLDHGYTRVKIKIGGRPLGEDLKRIDAVLPLDFKVQAQIARAYDPPLAAGEALFSLADARNLIRYGGLRPDRDVLLFDPVHCYGLPEYLRILEMLEGNGWSRSACQPHGGHLFSLHVAAALGLGGSESNLHNFQPFGGFADGVAVEDGFIHPPDAPGIGFETRSSLRGLFRSLAS